MADKEKFRNIEKRVQFLEKSDRENHKAREKAKAECDHQKKNHEPNLAKKNNKYFTCLGCKKDNISLANDILDETRGREARELIDNQLDIIKLNLNKDNADDEEIIAKIAKTQFFIRFYLPLLLDSLKKRNNKQKKKHDNEDSGWGKSKVI